MAEVTLSHRPSLMWPLSLPGKSLRGGYTGNTPFQGIRSTTDSGIDRVRASAIIPRQPWSVAYNLIRPQLKTLQDFARIATGHYFLWPHPWGDKVLLVARFKEEGSTLFSDTATTYNRVRVALAFETQQNVTFEYKDGPWAWR